MEKGAYTTKSGMCLWRPMPGSLLNAPCPECGHAGLLHIGVESCPVCKLVLVADQMIAVTESLSTALQSRQPGAGT